MDLGSEALINSITPHPQKNKGRDSIRQYSLKHGITHGLYTLVVGSRAMTFGTLEVQEDPRLLQVIPGNLESRTSPE